MVDKTREIALKVLYKIEEEKAYSNIILNKYISDNKSILDQKDIGLLSEIVYGVTTWKLTLDYIIQKYSKIKLKKISPWIINILRMGIYQIIFLDKIPKSAAVNESVTLAKRYGHKASSSFVNAILRRIEKKDYLEIQNIEDIQERISKTTSMPIWIVKQLLKERNNIAEVKMICESLLERPKLTVRRNSLKTTKIEFEKLLDKNQIIYENIKLKNEENEEFPSDFYILEKVRDIENMELFKNGYLTVQDFSAGLSAFYLEPKKGENILDACSAPGGKTTYLAEIMENVGEIEAWDIHKQRTNLVEENARRLGISIITTKQKDATIFYEEYVDKFDKILLDVPCMGIGVIKRKPDIKWQKTEVDVEIITKIQSEILDNCSKYVKKGGTIIYSTCSILKEENQNIIMKFLKSNKNFCIQKIMKNKDFLDILPDEKQDGFFIAKLQKK